MSNTDIFICQLLFRNQRLLFQDYLRLSRVVFLNKLVDYAKKVSQMNLRIAKIFVLIVKAQNMKRDEILS